MNTNLMAVLSLVVVVALIAVLVAFVKHLARLLRRTGDTLAAAVPVVVTIRQDCENVIGGVLALNQNLSVAADGLTGAVGAAQKRATSAVRERVAAAAAQERAAADAARERAALEAVRERAAADAVHARAAAEARERAAADARERASAMARERASAMARDRLAAGPAAPAPDRAAPQPTDRGRGWLYARPT